MIAIPIDSKTSTTISKLYGNAPCFGLLNLEDGSLNAVKNQKKGSGLEIAPFLHGLGVKATIYKHMGEGVYKSFDRLEMDIFCCKDEHTSIEEIYQGLKVSKFPQLTKENFKEYLDPGEGGKCLCGCENK